MQSRIVKSVANQRLSTRSLRAVCRALRRTYGNPRHGNPQNPLDDLIYIILSTRTRDPKFRETFRSLKRAFPNWERISHRGEAKIERILAPGGLARVKTTQIVSIVAQLKRLFGSATLSPLKNMTNSRAEAVLTALPGVGPKIAKCVLMYTLKRAVLPVDVHVHRLAGRLGLRTKKRPDTSQQLIESAVSPELRYSFHVNAIALGRSVCLSKRPKCRICPVSKWCDYYHSRIALRGMR